MRRRATVALSLVLAAGGCSDAAPSPTATVAPPVDLVVSSVEWRFVPARASVDAGATLTVELRNDGTIVHNWTVLSEAVTTESDYRDAIRIAGVTAQPSGIGRVTFEAPAPGEYQIICTIPGHFSSGMEGTLVVAG